MQTFKQFLRERLALDVAKKYTKAWSNRSKYDSWFGKNVYRLYFNVNGNELTQNGNLTSSLKSQIEIILNKNGYEIENFDLGLAKKKGTDKNFIKIGKLLNKFNELELKKSFDLMMDKSSKVLKTETDDYIVVISRHPYDIAGMSTDREWKSCLEIDKKTGDKPSDYEYYGDNYKDVINHVRANSLIAYLIRPDDKNIENPIGRLLIVAYESMNRADNFLVINRNSYGKEITQFRNIIQKWLDEKQGKINNFYRRPKELLYNDGDLNYFGDYSKSYPKFFNEVKKGNIVIDANTDIFFSNLLWFVEGVEKGLIEVYKITIKYDYKFEFHGGKWNKGSTQSAGYSAPLVDFIGCEWKDGEFNSTNFKNGVFKNGFFKGQSFINSTFKNGKFYGKSFSGSIFENGIFLDGMFFNDSKWIHGEWVGGYDEEGGYHDEKDSPDKWNIK